jgi:inorganic triphosphatase YgiF
MLPSENLLRTSLAQWRTNKKLLEMTPKNAACRTQIFHDAQRARQSLERSMKGGKMPSSQHAAVEELAELLDAMIEEISEESTPRMVAVR